MSTLAVGARGLRRGGGRPTGIASLSLLLIALPLAGAVVLLLGGRRLDRVGHLHRLSDGPGSPSSSAWRCSSRSSASPADARFSDVYRVLLDPGWPLQVDFGLRIDPLSLTFVLLITGVGSLIHIYSIGYMAHDPRPPEVLRLPQPVRRRDAAAGAGQLVRDAVRRLGGRRPGVVPADRLLVDRPAAATAAKKAFIMNRVGDVGLAIAIFLMFKEFGTTSFDGVFARIGALAEQSPGTVTAMALLLLLGACGKSGQVPLQAWLPDAMEGPTPVSALIHAATMVTAGVYLISRCYADLRPHRGRPAGRHHRRRGHPAGRLHRRLRQGRHQEGAGLLDGLADRLHVPGRRARRRRVRAGHPAPAHPRLLQSRPVPRRRLGHARDERRRGHAPLRRAGAPDADHVRHLHLRLPGADRLPVPVPGFFSKDPIIEAAFARRRAAGLAARRRRPARRRADRLLHDPADADDVLRRAALEEPEVRRRAATTTRTRRRRR